MKNQEQTESILLKVSKQQKDAITTAAKAAGMNVSEYIRSRAISHRASFQIPGEDNEFYTVSQQWVIIDTRTNNVAHSLTDEMRAKFRAHDNGNYHQDCVICQQNDAERKAEVIAAEEDRADYDATINSVRQ